MTDEETRQVVERVESSFDKERTELTELKRDHHSTWDRYIFTLSAAAIGFCFTVLPLAGSCYTWIALIGICSFVGAILLSGFAILVLDTSLQFAEDSHIKRKRQIDKLRKLIKKRDDEIAEIATTDSNDQKMVEELLERISKESDEILAEHDPAEEERTIDRMNWWINRLNRGRMYLFFLGIISITIFAVLNIDSL